MPSKNFVITAVLVLAFAIGGYYLGSSQALPSLPAGTGNASEFSKIFGSKVTKSITLDLSGEITALSDASLTVKNQGESLKLAISANTLVTKARLAGTGKVAQPPEAMKISDLKVGDKIDISASLVADGTIRVSNIMLSSGEAVISPSVVPSP